MIWLGGGVAGGGGANGRAICLATKVAHVWPEP